MADQNKFEEMLERLINEDKEGAQELFHEIVVEKSRDIYESLLESDLDEIEEDEEVEESEDDEAVEESADEEVDESDEDDLEEGFDLDEFEVEADPMDMGGDPADDMMADLEGGDDEDEGDMDDEEGDDDMEDRVMDLEDALDDLKAEFEKMMAGDDEGDDMDDEEGDEEEAEEESYAFESDDTEIEEGGHSDQMIKDKENMSKAEFEKKYGDAAKDMDESAKSAGETMREYVEKVTASMGDNGVNNKSAVAGKNDMGGTAANIARGDTANDGEAGAGSKVKGSALNDQNPKEDNAGNVNVPGAKAAKAGKGEPGHGAEKKGKPESADNKTSVVGK